MAKSKKIAFIGAGNMTRAMIAGLIQNGFEPNDIWASSPTIAKRKNTIPFPIHFVVDNQEAVKAADTIVFAVKPPILERVCGALKDSIQEKKNLIISVAAGVTTHSIAAWLDKKNIAIVRTMPNIAAAVGAGVTGLYANERVTENQIMIAESLFRSIGATLWLTDENQLNVITAISGSGPAYLFYFFEAMQKTAESFGIDTEKAKFLVSQTAMGAAKLVMESGDSFEQLRRFVTSEKGTTAAAIDVFTQHQTQQVVEEAMRAALLRAKELSR